jgi:glucose-6-phosphate isomerase
MSHETYGPRTHAWRELARAAKRTEAASIGSLFAADPKRFEHLSLEALGLLFDFSRQRLDPRMLGQLVALA